MISIIYTAKKGLQLLDDEKGAWMASKVAETLVGAELVTDGDMPSTTNWTAGSNTTLSISGGALRVTAVANGYAFGYQTITCVVGQRYKLIGDFVTDGTTGASFLNIGTTAGGAESLFVNMGDITGNYFGSFVATATTHYVGMAISSSTLAGEYSEFDNMAVRLSVTDLTSNINDLSVYGSVIKSAVNTNCETMAYSNFTAANYLRQPFNTGLDFGTGNFGFMGWAKSITNASSTQTILQLGDNASGVEIYIGRVTAGGGGGDENKITFLVKGATTTTGVVIGNTSLLAADGFKHITVLRRNNVFELHVNAALDTTDATNVGSLSHTTEVLDIGWSDRVVTSSEMSLTMWRAFDYAPTAAQIKQIYNKEKELFRPDRVYTKVDGSYSLDLDASALTPSNRTVKRTQESLGGVKSTLVHHQNEIWDVTTLPVTGIEVDRIRRFLASAMEGGSFVFDPYGTIASPYDPVPCYLEGESFTENRLSNTDYFGFAFKVRAL